MRVEMHVALCLSLIAACGEADAPTPTTESAPAPASTRAVGPDPAVPEAPAAEEALGVPEPTAEDQAHTEPPSAERSLFGGPGDSLIGGGRWTRSCPEDTRAPTATCPGPEPAPRALRREVTRLLRRTAALHSYSSSESADYVRAQRIDAWVSERTETSLTVNVAYHAKAGGYVDTRVPSGASGPPESSYDYCIALRFEASDGRFALASPPCLPGLGAPSASFVPRRVRVR